MNALYFVILFLLNRFKLISLHSYLNLDQFDIKFMFATIFRIETLELRMSPVDLLLFYYIQIFVGIIHLFNYITRNYLCSIIILRYFAAFNVFKKSKLLI